MDSTERNIKKYNGWEFSKMDEKKQSVWADGKAEIQYGETSRVRMTLEICTEWRKWYLAFVLQDSSFIT